MDPVINTDVSFLRSFMADTKCQKNILVTGVSGMLGGYFLEFLCELARINPNDYRIIGITRRETPYLKRLSNFYSDLLVIDAPSSIQSHILQRKDWLVIHAASPASPESYIHSELALIETNIVSTLEIATALASSGGHLVLLSSGEVYGATPKLPTTETSYSGFDHLAVRGWYPESKRAGELISQNFANHYGFNATSLRVYHTFGPGINLDQSRIFSTVIGAIVHQNPIELRTTGTVKRSFLYVFDLMCAILICASRQGSSIYNVAGDDELSIFEFSQIGSDIGGRNCPVITSSTPISQTGEAIQESPILRGLADTTALKSLGWQPRVSISDGLSRTTESILWRNANIESDE